MVHNRQKAEITQICINWMDKQIHAYTEIWFDDKKRLNNDISFNISESLDIMLKWKKSFAHTQKHMLFDPFISNSILGKFIDKEWRLVVSWGWMKWGEGGTEWRLTINRQGVSFRVNKYVLKPDCPDGYKLLYINILR